MCSLYNIRYTTCGHSEFLFNETHCDEFRKHGSCLVVEKQVGVEGLCKDCYNPEEEQRESQRQMNINGGSIRSSAARDEPEDRQGTDPEHEAEDSGTESSLQKMPRKQRR